MKGMKIRINGSEIDAHLRQRLQNATRNTPAICGETCATIRAVLTLRESPDEATFDARHLEILRAANSANTAQPRRPAPHQGVAAQLLYPLRKTLWKLLLPVVEEQIWRQNAINRALTHALELQRINVSCMDRGQTITAPANRQGKPNPALETKPGTENGPAKKPIRRIEQWLAGFSPGDAVSQDALAIQAACSRMGLACDLLAPAENIDPAGRSLCSPFSERANEADKTTTLRLYHYSIGSPLTGFFLRAPGPRVLRYHNITPPKFFTGFDDRLAGRLREGRNELQGAAAAADAVWAVSKFNAAEIAPFTDTPVTALPLLLSMERLALPAKQSLLRKMRKRRFVNILFVGRLAPNKRLEELMLAFDHYHRFHNARSRLLIVGSTRSCPRYYAMLWMLAAALRNPAICFEDFAEDHTLNAYYQSADLFLSTSEHEGYGAPLVEAMAHNVPVMARCTGGTPEAMGGAGILFEKLSPATLAGLMHFTVENRSLRKRIIGAQQQRIERLRRRDPVTELKKLLNANETSN